MSCRWRKAGTDSQVRQILLEEALFQGLFDADWTVGRTALYALYEAREQYDGLDNWLKAQFAGKETDLTLVRELAEKRLRRDEKEWLTSLLPPPPFTGPDYHANWGELDGPTSMGPGAGVPLNVVVYNHGQATWAVKGPETVQLGYRWCAKRTWRFLQGESPCWVRANHPPIPSVATVRKVVQEV